MVIGGIDDMKHADKCTLATRCKLANSESCTSHCGAYIAMHGLSGLGGRVGAANIPRDYLSITMTNSPVRGSQKAVYKAADKYATTFDRQFEDNGDRVKSLYLYSDSPGTGKTTTAIAILNEWIVQHYLGSLKRGQEPKMKPALFFDVNEFQSEYNLATMSKSDSDMDRIKAKITEAMKAPFLVLDDIGVRSATEAFRAYVHMIINHRTANAMPTVYTSNFPIVSDVAMNQRIEANKPYDMLDVFDKRLQDRMRDMCLSVTFEGESKRGIR